MVIFRHNDYYGGFPLKSTYIECDFATCTEVSSLKMISQKKYTFLKSGESMQFNSFCSSCAFCPCPAGLFYAGACPSCMEQICAYRSQPVFLHRMLNREHCCPGLSLLVNYIFSNCLRAKKPVGGVFPGSTGLHNAALLLYFKYPQLLQSPITMHCRPYRPCPENSASASGHQFFSRSNKSHILSRRCRGTGQTSSIIWSRDFPNVMGPLMEPWTLWSSSTTLTGKRSTGTIWPAV